eukprot:122916_1
MAAEAPKLITYSHTTVEIDKVIVTACLIHNISLFGKVFLSNMKSKELSIGKHSELIVYSLHFMHILTVASFFIYNVVGMFAVFDFFITLIGCKDIILISIIWYFSVKYFTWMYSLIRLVAAFNSSAYGYSKPFLYCLGIILTINLIIVNLFSILFIDYETSNIPNTNTVHCLVRGKMMSLVSIMLDMTASIGCFWLLYRKMKILQSISITDPEFNTSLIYVIKKFTILSATAILSTSVLSLFVTFTSFSLSAAAVDTVFNCWCIVLFDVRYNNSYKTLFGWMACAKVAQNENKKNKNVEISIQTVNSNSKSRKITKNETYLVDCMESTDTPTKQ